VRRRRECRQCGERLTTFESAELVMPRVVKSDATREPFDESKLRSGMVKALEKRPVAIEAVRSLGGLGDPAAAPALMKIIQAPKPDPQLRLEAVTAIGATGGEGAYETLLDILADPSPLIRAAALRARARFFQPGEGDLAVMRAHLLERRLVRPRRRVFVDAPALRGLCARLVPFITARERVVLSSELPVAQKVHLASEPPPPHELSIRHRRGRA